MSRTCPAEHDLRGFAMGRLEAARIDDIGDHLECCDSCSAKVAAIEGEADELIGKLGPQASTTGSILDSLPIDTAMERDQRDLHSPAARFPIRLNCPHCQNPISVVEGSNAQDAVCPACGSTIRIDHDRQLTWSPDRLPTLGKFELLRSVGHGAFGTVYRARDTELGRIVAVKVPRSGRFTSPEDEQQFIREARTAGQLSHPGIVPIFEVGKYESFPFIVAEFVEGVTLADALSTRRFSFSKAARLLAEVSETIQFSHDQGITHRDLKPSNIMLQPLGMSVDDFRPRVMDFGLAHREGGEVTIHRDGCILGTPAYGSPEQLSEDSRVIDARTDVYSLGVILYEMLTGELPFRGTLRMLIYQVLNDEPRAPRRLNDRIPRDLETICLKCLQKDPNRRYPTAKALADDLRRYLAGEAILARPIGLVEKAQKWVRRQPMVASLIAAVFCSLTLGIVAASFFALRAQAFAVNAEQEKLRADQRAIEAQQSAVFAEEQRKLAVEAGDKAREESLSSKRHLYVTSMNLIPPAWEVGNVKRIKQLLDSQRPESTGGTDFRGFEWYYWWRQCHKYEMSLPGHGSALCVAVSKDIKGIVVGSKAGFIHCWEPVSGELLHKIQVGDQPVTAVAIYGDLIGAPGPSNSVGLWDFKTGELKKSFPSQAAPVADLAFNGTGKWLLTGSEDGALKLWDVATGLEVRQLAKSESPVTHVAYSRTGGIVASVTEAGGKVTVLNDQTGEVVAAVKKFGSISAIDFSPNGKLLAVACLFGSEDRVEIYDTTTGEKTNAWRGHGDASVGAIAFLSDGTLATAATDETVKVWTAAGKNTMTFRGHLAGITAIAKNCNRVFSASIDGTARVWYGESQPTRELHGFGCDVRTIAFSPDSKHVAGTARDNVVKIMEVDSKRTHKVLSGHAKQVLALSYNREGTLLATGSEDATVRIWELGSDAPPREITEHKGPVVAAEFSADGSRLLTASHDGLAIIWDVKSLRPLKVFEGHRGCVVYATWSPDGEWVASIGGATVDERRFAPASMIVWNSHNLEHRFPPRSTIASKQLRHSIAFSPNGLWIAYLSPYAKESLLVLDAKTGEVVHAIADPGSETGFTVTFDPTSQRIAAGSLATTSIWDVETGLEVIPDLRFTDAWTLCLKFSPDGKRLAAGAYGTTVGVFDTHLHASMHPRSRERALEELGSTVAP